MLLETSLADLVVKKKGTKKSLKKSSLIPACANKSTTASRTRKVPSNHISGIERKFNKLEKEINSRFRLLEEKLTTRVVNMEKRMSAIEEERANRTNANMELLKRVHAQAKEEVQSVQAAIENMQVAVTKSTEDHEKIANVMDKYKRNRLVTHNFEQRLQTAEKRLNGIDSDMSVPAFRYQLSMKPGADKKFDKMRENEVWKETTPPEQQLPPPPTVSVDGALPPEMLALLKKKIKDCERGIAASIKLTQASLDDQRAAILFLFKSSNIASKASMSDREVLSIFGKLGGLGGRTGLDDLWS